jgi:hypothetical protein
MDHVRRCHFETSEVGLFLTTALLEQGQQAVPAFLKGLPRSAVRWYIGDELADMIGVPPADWTRRLFGPLARMAHRSRPADSRPRGMERMSAWLGRSLLAVSVAAGRGGDRASFAIPDELADSLLSRPRRLARIRGGAG